MQASSHSDHRKSNGQSPQALPLEGSITIQTPKRKEPSTSFILSELSLQDVFVDEEEIAPLLKKINSLAGVNSPEEFHGESLKIYLSPTKFVQLTIWSIGVGVCLWSCKLTHKEIKELAPLIMGLESANDFKPLELEQESRSTKPKVLPVDVKEIEESPISESETLADNVNLCSTSRVTTSTDNNSSPISKMIGTSKEKQSAQKEIPRTIRKTIVPTCSGQPRMEPHPGYIAIAHKAICKVFMAPLASYFFNWIKEQIVNNSDSSHIVLGDENLQLKSFRGNGVFRHTISHEDFAKLVDAFAKKIGAEFIQEKYGDGYCYWTRETPDKLKEKAQNKLYSN